MRVEQMTETIEDFTAEAYERRRQQLAKDNWRVVTAFVSKYNSYYISAKELVVTFERDIEPEKEQSDYIGLDLSTDPPTIINEERFLKSS